MPRPARRRWKAVALAVFVLQFCALGVWGNWRSSATWDETQSLADGLTIEHLGDFRIDPEHPPLLREWAALPLLATHLRFDTASRDWARGMTWAWSRHFIFELNDGDSLLFRARMMIMSLGVLLGALLFFWADELFGFIPAATALALYGFEPNIVAHANLVTTDFGVVCFMFATLYGLWRATRRLTWTAGLGTILGFTLAVTSKFSALLLLPMMGVLLGIRALGAEPWKHGFGQGGEWTSRRARTLVASALIALCLLAGYAGTWAVYGFRYRPSPPGAPPIRFNSNHEIAQLVPRLNRIVVWIDDHHLLPNACSHGFLRGQAKLQRRPAYLEGMRSATGWWYFFPFAIGIKTPLGLLALALAGLGVAGANVRRQRWALYVTVPIVVYLAAAMHGHLDIGLRHVLPVYPFLILGAGAAVAWLEEHARLRWIWVAASALSIAEIVPVAPHWLAFFNRLVGGPSQGHEYLVDSNLDWGQELKDLKRWMDTHGVARINLAYFGTAVPQAYGIQAVAMPGTGPDARLPILPGWIAVSATTLHGVYVHTKDKPFYAPLLARKPDAVLGYSMFLFHVTQPWWPADAGTQPDSPQQRVTAPTQLHPEDSARPASAP